MNTEQVANSKIGSDALVDSLATGAEGDKIGEQLFEIATLFEDNQRLLRSATDPGRSTADRVKMTDGLISGKVLPGTDAVVRSLIGLHWANPQDLVYTLRELGVESDLRVAKTQGNLEQIEQELIGIGHVLVDNRDLRTALSPLSGKTQAQRQELAQQVFGKHILPTTALLLKRAVALSQHGRLVQKLRQYARVGSDLQGAQLVMVRTASAFTQKQRDRLKALLELQLKQPVTLGVVSDPSLIGGFRISYGSEARDSSIRADVVRAKQALAR